MIKKNKKFLFPTEEEDDLYLDEGIEDMVDDMEEDDEISSQVSSAFTPEYQKNQNIREVKEQQTETKIFKPKCFADSKEIMQTMIKANSAIVDISDLINNENGQREAEKIICYLCGVSDALGILVKKINVSTFFFQAR